MKKILPIDLLDGTGACEVTIVIEERQHEVTRSDHPDFENLTPRARPPYYRATLYADDLAVGFTKDFDNEEALTTGIKDFERQAAVHMRLFMKAKNKPTIQQKMKQLGYL